jgi:hypothetical protein
MTTFGIGFTFGLCVGVVLSAITGLWIYLDWRADRDDRKAEGIE